MIDLIICLTLLNIATNSNTPNEYNREVSKIEKIMGQTLPCRAFEGELKNSCNNPNLIAILRTYHFNMQADQIKKENK